MKTLRTPGCSCSTDSVSLFAPRSWREMTQEQLRYVFYLLSHISTLAEVKTYMLMRFCGISIDKQDEDKCHCVIHTDKGRHRFILFLWQIQEMIHQFDYVDTYEEMGVRLESIRGSRAVDVDLHGVSFSDYLNMEKYYQGYLNTKGTAGVRGPIDMLGSLLYRTPDGAATAGMTLDETERTAVFMWYGYVRSNFAKSFPYLFSGDGSSGKFNFMAMVNAQIRALTDGDVTKEREVLEHTDCWRALTELNEKAREAKELKASMSKR